MFDQVRRQDPEIASAILAEIRRQGDKIELIASENFVSTAVLEALGSPLTNKYAEGYPGKRYYGGCEYVDVVETLAIERAKQLFGADHANVQPHSGAQANTAVYFAALEPGDVVLGMNLTHGGHLTHGMHLNISGKYFKFIPYGVRAEDHRIDYEGLEELAALHRPKMIVAGASAYPRSIDFRRIREIATGVGALVLVDMAHIAGLIAAGLHNDPVPYADFVTTTTHKTLRGPRGGMILCTAEWAKRVDSAIFPGIQGGPLMHVIAAKAVAFGEALRPEFAEYQRQILRNAQALSSALMELGFSLVSGGTDNHLMLVNLMDKGITGKAAEHGLDNVGITVNKNTIPFDPEKPTVTSGIRLGTPAVTTRGMKEPEMREIACLIAECLTKVNDTEAAGRIRAAVAELTSRFPLYSELR